jgi:valyl-tRNA synthetase
VDDAAWAKLAAADYSGPAALAALPLTERWVVSSLHQLVDRVTACQEDNDFSEAGQARLTGGVDRGVDRGDTST